MAVLNRVIPWIVGSIVLTIAFVAIYVVYSTSGLPESGSGYLGGELAQVPTGVIDVAARSGTNGVTWQPRPGLRFATVELAANGKVVLAGQSLLPSESRTDQLGFLLLLGWALAMLILAAGAFLHVRFVSDK